MGLAPAILFFWTSPHAANRGHPGATDPHRKAVPTRTAATAPDQPVADLPLAMNQPDDDCLMRAFARGDAAAFEALYARHHGALYRFVRRLLGSACANQVDEVFQDSWLKVVQARDQWSPQGASFRTWLFTLAHHRAVDCLRRSGREQPLPLDEDGEPLVSGGSAAGWPGWPDPCAAGPPDASFWRAAGRQLLHCLDELPTVQRAVFLLHHEDGLTLDELATALGLGFETAKSRLRYAMSKLRGCMAAYLDPTPAGAP